MSDLTAYVMNHHGDDWLASEIGKLEAELAALKASTEPVAVVHEVYVAPNSDGKSRAIVLSDERLSQGAELYTTPPTTTANSRGY